MNWTFFNMTRRIEFFLSMSQRIGFLSFCQKKKTTQRIELSPKIRYKELNFFFFQYDSKIFFNMTRRIEPFFITWLKDLVFFFTKKKTQRIWLLMTHRLEPSFQNIFTQKKWLEELIPFFIVTLKFFFFEIRIRLTELNFFQYDSQNWTCFFFLNMTFFFDIELFFFWIRLEEMKFSNTTQRIQLFSLIWLQELNLFCMTLWIELFFQEIWLDSSNWTSFYEFLFKMTKRVEVFLLTQELNLSCLPMWLNEFFAANRKKVQCIASSKKKAQLFESNFKMFNSLSLNSKTILWIIFKTGFNSLSHIEKNSILRVMWRKVQFWVKKSSIFWLFQPKFQLSHIQKNGIDALSRIRKKKEFDFLSHTQKEIQFFESYLKQDSILWVTLKKRR